MSDLIPELYLADAAYYLNEFYKESKNDSLADRRALELLRKGIARYAPAQGCRFLIGCSSLPSQDPAHGARVYEILREYEAEPALRTNPQPEFALPPASTAEASGHIPKLLRRYLAVGARICRPPWTGNFGPLIS